MTANLSAPRWHAGVKVLLFGLIACNALVYARSGTLNEALDSAAWLVLLSLFLFETGNPVGAHRAGTTVRLLRLVAAAAIAAAAAGYVRDEEWLDAANTGVWIAVIVLLELELRRPVLVAAHRPWLVATAAVLYAGLAVPVAVWAWRGDWFDAYDALLWLAAFAMIEMNVLRRPRVPTDN